MLPTFNLKREQTTQLYAVDVCNIYCEFHFHSHVELLAVLEGTVEVTINDKQKSLGPGEIAVALSYDAHQFRSPGYSRGISMAIPTEMCREFISAVGDRETNRPFLHSSPLFDTVCDCFKKIQESSNALCAKGHLYVLLGSLLSHMQLDQRQETSDPRLLTTLLLYISKHYASDISLASIAAALGYNPSYLSRIFSSCFHISIPSYIAMLRLRQAVLLMQDPAKSITDCAFESGFRSLRTFYRTFGEEFHCSPKEYRQKSL